MLDVFVSEFLQSANHDVLGPLVDWLTDQERYDEAEAWDFIRTSRVWPEQRYKGSFYWSSDGYFREHAVLPDYIIQRTSGIILGDGLRSRPLTVRAAFDRVVSAWLDCSPSSRRQAMEWARGRNREVVATRDAR